METTVSKKSYDRSFKERAVKLSQERDNIKYLAAELGISPERIYKWRAEFARHDQHAGGTDDHRLPRPRVHPNQF